MLELNVQLVFTGTIQKEVKENTNGTQYRWCSADIISINGTPVTAKPVLVQVYQSTLDSGTVDPTSDEVYQGTATQLGDKAMVHVTPKFNTTPLTTFSELLEAAGAKEEIVVGADTNGDDLPF